MKLIKAPCCSRRVPSLTCPAFGTALALWALRWLLWLCWLPFALALLLLRRWVASRLGEVK